jgi:hypothetical protein
MLLSPARLSTRVPALSFACTGDAAVTCMSVDLVGKVLAAGNVLGRTVLYILETSEQLCELRCVCMCARDHLAFAFKPGFWV